MRALGMAKAPLINQLTGMKSSDEWLLPIRVWTIVTDPQRIKDPVAFVERLR